MRNLWKKRKKMSKVRLKLDFDGGKVKSESYLKKRVMKNHGKMREIEIGKSKIGISEDLVGRKNLVVQVKVSEQEKWRLEEILKRTNM